MVAEIVYYLAVSSNASAERGSNLGRVIFVGVDI